MPAGMEPHPPPMVSLKRTLLTERQMVSRKMYYRLSIRCIPFYFLARPYSKRCSELTLLLQAHVSATDKRRFCQNGRWKR